VIYDGLPSHSLLMNDRQLISAQESAVSMSALNPFEYFLRPFRFQSSSGVLESGVVFEEYFPFLSWPNSALRFILMHT